MQAERWGSELITDDVEYVDLSKRPFAVRTSDLEVRTAVDAHHELALHVSSSVYTLVAFLRYSLISCIGSASASAWWLGCRLCKRVSSTWADLHR